MNSDVLIIGGGVIGLAIARELHKKQVGKITILERGKVGKEASHAAAGMLAPHAETEKKDDFFISATNLTNFIQTLPTNFLTKPLLILSSTVKEHFISLLPKQMYWKFAAALIGKKAQGCRSRIFRRRKRARRNHLFHPTFWKVCFSRTIGRSKTANSFKHFKNSPN